MISLSTNATVELAKKVVGKYDAVVVVTTKEGRPDGLEELPAAARAAAEAVVKAKAMGGKAHEVVSQVVGEPAPHRLLLVGVGVGEKVTAESLREAGAAVAKAARRYQLEKIAMIVPERLKVGNGGGGSRDVAIEALTVGFLLGSFHFEEYKGSVTKRGEESKVARFARLTLVTPDVDAAAREAMKRARVVADGQNLARTVASRPGNEINPPSLAKVAQEVAKAAGLGCRVLDDRELKRLGMGGLLAVGSGSPNPPRLIALEHKGSGFRVRGSGKAKKTSALLGLRTGPGRRCGAAPPFSVSVRRA